MADRPRVALVQPRYGADVVGGSEALMREVAHGLVGREWDVDVLTTAASSHYTWENVHPTGVEVVDGVVVHRFAVERQEDHTQRDEIEARIQLGAAVSPADQAVWANTLFRVPDLLHHVVTHAGDYDALLLSPYLFWTTLAAVSVVPERTIVMPCLHDEPYAHLAIFGPVLSTPAALWFLSEPEHQLAHRIGPLPDRHVVTGAGVRVPERYDGEGFARRHGLERPYVLFAGRRELGKGWNWLLSAYYRAVTQHDLPLDLVTIGVGPVDVPPSLAGRVIDLGLLEEHEVPDAFAGAVASVQPSPNESFSRTIMESWLAGTVVLATAKSEVLSWHVARSAGGLTFADEFELVECLAFVASNAQLCADMAKRGRRYVLDNYSWERVLDAMEASLEDVVCGSS
jgi:glycosyltransferase involved in cell wall biosynthesis